MFEKPGLSLHFKMILLKECVHPLETPPLSFIPLLSPIENPPNKRQDPTDNMSHVMTTRNIMLLSPFFHPKPLAYFPTQTTTLVITILCAKENLCLASLNVGVAPALKYNNLACRTKLMCGCEPTAVTVKYCYMLKSCHSALVTEEPVTVTVQFLILVSIRTHSE